MLKDLFTNKGINLPPRPTDLRAHRNANMIVTLTSGNLTSNQKSVTAGVCARVFDKGVYGFASTASMDSDSVKKVLASAQDNAGFFGGRAKSDLGDLSPLAPGDENPQIKEKEVPQKMLLDYARELDAHIAAKYPGLAGRTIMINCLEMEKFLFSSNGGESPVMRSHSLVPRTVLMVSMIIKDAKGAPINLNHVVSEFAFFPDVLTKTTDHHADLDSLYERLVKKSEGVYASAGTHLLVMGPEITGMLAHEAIGHTVEADLVMGGAVSAHFMNKQVASELVTMIDYAHTKEDGKPAHCPVVIDDEGTIAKDALLIDKGILRTYMHDRASAKRLGYEPTGNARAWQYNDEPLIRMRNTAILPGKSKLSDLIESVDDGYYLVKTGNGQADGTSEFMFSINEGYEIKGGKIGKAIRDTTISGVAFDMLKTVDMVSDDMLWRNSGMCGKKQPIPTSNGGPALRCYANLGGR
ncbi:MAG: TldD/PmbA family protein [Treponema sp.]|nr:TldD/PmbA family protein [Treponema sp.]